VVTRAALGSRFEAAADTLHRLFPAYADALTLSGVIDILYGVGFLGVRRGNDVVFAGEDDLPVQPHETEFHVHRCFREALGATTAMDLRRYEPVLAGDRIAQATAGNAVTVITALNRDDRLLQALSGSCHSILAQVGRAVGLTPDAREEITQQINRVLDDVNSRPAGAVSADAADQLLTTAHYFTSLAAQLLASGLDDIAGAGGVAHRIESEARRLRRMAGGSYGSSGNSSGP
jgi:hypothetical protein